MCNLILTIIVTPNVVGIVWLQCVRSMNRYGKESFVLPLFDPNTHFCFVSLNTDGLFQFLFFCFVTVIEVDHGWGQLTHSHFKFFPLVLSPWKKAR